MGQRHMAPTLLSFKTRGGGGVAGGFAYKDRAQPPPPLAPLGSGAAMAALN